MNSPKCRTYHSLISRIPRANPDRDAALEGIKRRLRLAHVKVDTIIQRCEEIDRNKDGIIHPDDFLDIVNECLPVNSLSRRERRYLIDALTNRKNSVALEYKKLGDVLKDSYDNRFEVLETDTGKEKWLDDDPVENGYESRWTSQPGSIGEWLERAACPAEQSNYVRFLNCLERFERESGMKIIPHEDGFMLPLGPDLRASIQFFIA